MKIAVVIKGNAKTEYKGEVTDCIDKELGIMRIYLWELFFTKFNLLIIIVVY